ncbi:MAG TPA: extracellular solute-binding protein [Beijerinckiaceae bacterium]|nr:extracellular solute-binding protein [Beijerinckiaceae bacterium]
MSRPAIRGFGVIAALGVLAGGLLGFGPAPAAPAEAMRESYAIAMHGAPALPPGYTHFPSANPDAPKGGRLRLGFLGTFDSLNPFNLKAGSTAQGLIGNVYQTLMMRSYDEPFTLYGSIARSIETNADRSRVIFHLDPRAKFSDGHPITSKDVRFTFDLLKKQGRPQERIAFSKVAAVETPDPLTVDYDLAGLNDREMPLILGLMPVLPAHLVDTADFSDSSMKIPVGSGPYTVASVNPGESLTLKRNRNYWAKDLPSSRGMYNFNHIRIDYYRDANALYEAFKAGLIDYREESSPIRWLTGYDFPAMRDGRIVRESLPLGGPKGMQGFVFNLRRPIFDDVRVRDAIGWMFDFEWINANLFGGLYVRTKSYFDDSILSSVGRPASPQERALLARFPGVVRPDILAGTWRPPHSDGSGRDRTTARHAMTLLEQAGYRLNNGVLVNKTTHAPLEFEIMVADSQAERLALNFAQSLRRIGVIAHVRLVDDVQFQRRRQKFDFDMTIGSWVASASPGNEEWSRWGSRSADQEASFNLAGVKSPAVDFLIKTMLAAHSEEDFVTAVRALDRVLLSGFYIVPLYHSPDQWFAYSSKLAHPRPAHYARPLFGATLDTFWRKTP